MVRINLSTVKVRFFPGLEKHLRRIDDILSYVDGILLSIQQDFYGLTISYPTLTESCPSFRDSFGKFALAIQGTDEPPFVSTDFNQPSLVGDIE
jgi:hypothetical protein